MKKIVTFFLFILCIQTTKAQFVTIPDATFVTWLQTNVPSAMIGNQMDTTSLSVTTRTNVNVFALHIYNLSGIEYFKSLKRLSCGVNNMTSLQSLPTTLKYLECSAVPLSGLPILPNTLDTLICSGNWGINNLTGLPSSLLFLDCTGCRYINTLGNLPAGLQHLVCRDLSINTITPLPLGLKYFDCGSNSSIISSYVLPASLLSFACDACTLTTLPNLPFGLINLACPNNNLTNIASLPPILVTLDCSYNLLPNLPPLPSTLKYLNCEFNQLSTLPNLPNTLTYLDCLVNQITSLPSLPDSLTWFACDANQISCFPVFPDNNYTQFGISSNPFTCLPNYVQGMPSDILNYPLCVPGNTTTNSSGCITNKGITGFAYRDVNIDCTRNIGEFGFTNGIMKLYDNSNTFLGLTNIYSNGYYYFSVPTGNYNVVLDTANKPFAVQCINPGIDSLINLTSSQTLADSIDFAIVCKPGFDIGVQGIYTMGMIFPGLTHTLVLSAGDMTQWNNISCASGISGTLSFTVNGAVSYIGPAPGALTPTVTGNVFKYTITDFGNINNFSDFKLVFQTDTTAQQNDAICINAIATPTNGDNNILNNTYQYCYYTVNSLDPNIKEVYPIEVQTGFNDWLTYTIHFQNTGNAPAMNIRLEDNLDSKLDPETFELINYSHYNVIDVTTNHLTVRFPNIQLADSTSDPQGSIGFVQYRIKPKAGWINDTIRNSAEIYFDYNAPIVTNTAKSYFMTTTGIKDMNYLNEVVELSPNPTNGIISVSSKTNFTKIEVLSITGQTLLSETVNSKTHQLQLQNFAEGIYFVRVVYPNGLSTVNKVIVSH